MKWYLSSLLLMAISPILSFAQPLDKNRLIQNDSNVSVEFLQSFADAFNAHDLDRIMSHMTENCLFEASAGPDADGEKFSGKAEVRKAFANVFSIYPDAHWGNARHFIAGNRGLSEWVFTGTKTDGTKVEVTGCDLFTFSEGKIAIKNSYRKNRTPGVPRR